MTREQWSERQALAMAAADRLEASGVCSAEVEPYVGEEGEISVAIYWGDWKHDHGWSREVLSGMGFDVAWSEVTEEDGSDCYSALTVYRRRW